MNVLWRMASGTSQDSSWRTPAMRTPTPVRAAFALLLMSLTAWLRAGSLDWKIRNVSVKPAPTVEGPVTIECQWRATVDEHFQWTKPFHWSGMFLVDGNGIHTFNVTYAPNNVNYMPPNDQDWQVGLNSKTDYDFGGTATNEFNGTSEHMISLGAGTHKVGCTIAVSGETGESTNRKGNNTKEITIEVKPINKVAPAQWPTRNPTVSISGRNAAPQASAGKIVLPRPTLSLTLPTTSFDQTCADPTQIATVNVGIHSDMPLAAYQGTLVVEDLKGGLSTAQVLLPAIGANATVPMTVKLATTVPPSSLVGEHSLNVLLKPNDVGGKPSFNAANSAGTGLVFPSGYCPSARFNPPPSGPGDGGTLALPGSKGRGAGLMVPTPTAHSIAGRPPNARARATTPVIPKLEMPPPGIPGFTPVPVLSSSTSPVPSSTTPADARPGTASSRSGALGPPGSRAGGTPHVFRPGERLALQDGRSLSRDGPILVLRDPRGAVLRSFPPGAEVFVGNTGDVTVHFEGLSEPLGALKVR
jgi:hypothetical protein